MNQAFIKTLLEIQRIVVEGTPDGHLPYQIDDIRDAIAKVTKLDEIIFKEFEVEGSPIIGKYERWERPDSVYGEATTVVDVQYSKQLNRCWSRWVACKEMCHSFIDGSDYRVDNAADLDRLVNYLLLEEQAQEPLGTFAPFDSERLALMGALELLAPLKDRKKVVQRRAAGDRISDMQIATSFRIPVDCVRLVFTENQTRLWEQVLGMMTDD